MAGPFGLAFFILVRIPFSYRQATTSHGAAQHLANPGAVALGGGTELLASIAEQIIQPQMLVDFRCLANLEGGRCRAVHASDRAVALAAMDAVVEIASMKGNQRVQ
jgi:CO/xanthine dehydrogenase FAD-binding subunit